ncbi:MAG: hypothetical protein K0S53_831 [Bacteroidetes bacterium]|jgi:hypothetical protein|nr:hypothetical protein [Bacteroidota bacterium]MDF2451460.1 hypothetical protein [Bacteroidota bacterium]
MTDKFTYKIKTPSECTDKELKEFYEIVLKGGKVQKEGLENRIRKCKYLGFCMDDEHPVGTSAIKQPSENYINTVIKDHLINRNASELKFEMGYSCTIPEYRKRGISSELKTLLLNKMSGEKGIIYCTTAILSSQHFLDDHGFTNVGVDYDGKNDKNIKYYEKQL